MKYFLYVDGASRGNPGKASIGVSLQDETGKEIETISRFIGHHTNNEAEYQALIEGLKLVCAKQISNIEVRADSQLVVRQMLGEYKVKHPKMKPLHREARALADSLEAFAISHVPRSENSRADELANRALDS